jgi:peptide-methionine (S)-S-oxide reductase
MLFPKKTQMAITPEQALPGRSGYAYEVPEMHDVLGTPMMGPFPNGLDVAYFGMGCFWGAERAFWQIPGVYTTAVGYQGGVTPYPTYKETCTGQTGQAETVMVVFDAAKVSYGDLLRLFWESHDPTQGMRQGNDIGSQYRSAIYTTTDAQLEAALARRDTFQQHLSAAGYGAITTEIAPAGPFYYAEDYHQQYLHKVPDGYCGLAGTGVSCPVGLGMPAPQDTLKSRR